MTADLELRPIGWVESVLTSKAGAPRQGDEGGPNAWLVFNESVRAGLSDLAVGDEILLLTWFDRASRDVLAVHPRNDQSRPLTGVFSTRSPDRPNPIGLHRVTILATADLRLQVNHLEALNNTPILDLKPVLADPSER